MSEELQEYYKIVDIVRGFDDNLVTIKGWGVTLGLAAIGLGFKEKSWGYFLLAALSGLAFWGIESAVKGHQMRYYPRMREIEVQAYANNATTPRMVWSWNESDRVLRGKVSPEAAMKSPPELYGEYSAYAWYARPFLPHIMLPHVISVAIGGALAVLAFRKQGRFRDYHP
jgi:hypothetical protein